MGIVLDISKTEVIKMLNLMNYNTIKLFFDIHPFILSEIYVSTQYILN